MSITTEPAQKTLINYRLDAGVAILEINDPPANTYTYEMNRQLDDAILRARMDKDVHVIVLTGGLMVVATATVLPASTSAVCSGWSASVTRYYPCAISTGSSPCRQRCARSPCKIKAPSIRHCSTAPAPHCCSSARSASRLNWVSPPSSTPGARTS